MTLSAQQLLDDTAGRYLRMVKVVCSFQDVMSVALHSPFRVTEAYAALLNLLFNDSVKKKLTEQGGFDPEDLDPRWNELAKLLSRDAMTDAWRSTHAAALVFCHSVVDAAAYGCCRITAVVDQKSWEDGVLDRKVSLRDLRSSSIEAMVSVIVERRVSELEGDSLLKKIDVLYERCKPPTKWAFSPSYSFDRERLGRIDDLRHRIVHEDGFNEIAPDAPKQVNYLVLTGYHLFHLIKLRYGLNLPPMFEEKQETSLTI